METVLEYEDAARDDDPTDCLMALRGILRALRVHQAIRSGEQRPMRVVELINVELLSDAPHGPN